AGRGSTPTADRERGREGRARYPRPRPMDDLPERPRRLRRTPALRRLARETRLHAAELIAPLFVEAGKGVRDPLPSLPGHFRWTPDTAAEEAQRLEGLGVGGVILFGIPAKKNATGTGGWDP